MDNRKGNEMKTTTVTLTNEQIQILRGVLQEYYSENFPQDEQEQTTVEELEEILGVAEDETV
jgi:Spy/CpxP family protein refolding chaperone